MKLYLFAFLVGVIGAYLAIQFADRIGISDIPNHRSSHEKIIPRGGGVGILASFVLGSLVLSVPVGLWLPSLIIALISLWGGDKHLLSAQERLFVQFACSMAFVVSFLYSKQIALGAYFLCVPISIFIVGTSNFYNFMDGIDGIAGITGVVGFSLISFYVGISGTNDVYVTLCLVLAFSCLGFLCFNIPRAKVFLGDIGSIMLGFVFACLVIVLSENIIGFVVMVGFLAPFYLDELFTMIVRIKHGDSLIVAHRKHIYQLLVNEVGIKHWKVSLAYGFTQAIIGLSTIFVKHRGIYFILLTYLIYSLIFAWVSIIIRKKVSI
ncbi:MAG: UDP-N-acetylmuramyl pentapeptide phosphotransferase [Desulfobacteraceae bacterium]|nr:UDP-N-acetylmuramyl pentapeptide phosphotransferase [Desulfobacteraceae bacterium]